MADQDIRFITTPIKGLSVRCFLSGGEPVVAAYDLPTGRAGSMIHQVLKNNPQVKQHAHVAILGTREAWALPRPAIRELIPVFQNITPHRADTRAANTALVAWMENDLIPFLDAWDQELRETKVPDAPIELFLTINAKGISQKTFFTDVRDLGTLTLSVNGKNRVISLHSLARMFNLVP